MEYEALVQEASVAQPSSIPVSPRKNNKVIRQQRGLIKQDQVTLFKRVKQAEIRNQQSKRIEKKCNTFSQRFQKLTMSMRVLLVAIFILL